jgi:hypothetical protein
MIFFGWNGILLLLEDSVVHTTFWNNYVMRYCIPSHPLIKGHLVVLLALPVSHLFTDDVVLGGFFSGVQHALPLVVVT